MAIGRALMIGLTRVPLWIKMAITDAEAAVIANGAAAISPCNLALAGSARSKYVDVTI